MGHKCNPTARPANSGDSNLKAHALSFHQMPTPPYMATLHSNMVHVGPSKCSRYALQHRFKASLQACTTAYTRSFEHPLQSPCSKTSAWTSPLYYPMFTVSGSFPTPYKADSGQPHATHITPVAQISFCGSTSALMHFILPISSTPEPPQPCKEERNRAAEFEGIEVGVTQEARSKIGQRLMDV